MDNRQYRMMASTFSPHPGVPPGHPGMAPGMQHNHGQPGGQPGGMPHLAAHMGVSGPNPPAAMMGAGIQPGAGPNAHLQHLTPQQAHLIQQQQMNQMACMSPPPSRAPDAVLGATANELLKSPTTRGYRPSSSSSRGSIRCSSSSSSRLGRCSLHITEPYTPECRWVFP